MRSTYHRLRELREDVRFYQWCVNHYVAPWWTDRLVEARADLAKFIASTTVTVGDHDPEPRHARTSFFDSVVYRGDVDGRPIGKHPALAAPYGAAQCS